MAVTVKMQPNSVIKTSLGINPGGRVHKYFTKRCADYMDKYVPYRKGGLAYDTRTIEATRIIYDAPYAHYMYEGKAMSPSIPIKDKSGNIVGWFSKSPKYYNGKELQYTKSGGHEYAGSYWDKRMWTAESKDVIEEVQQFINRGGK